MPSSSNILIKLIINTLHCTLFVKGAKMNTVEMSSKYNNIIYEYWIM